MVELIIDIPITTDGAQSVTVQLGDRKFTLEFAYNERSESWSMTLIDAPSQSVLLSSIALVLGQELLEPYNLKIGRMIVVDTTGQGIDAGPDDLGSRVKLFWVSADEVL